MPTDRIDSLGDSIAKSGLVDWAMKKMVDSVSDIHPLQFNNEQVAETLNALRTSSSPAVQKQAHDNIDVIAKDLDWAVEMSAQPLQKKDMRFISAHKIIKEVQRGLNGAHIQITDSNHDGQYSPTEVQQTFRNTVANLSKPQR